LDTHPWNWDNFNAKNLWSWQLGNASLPMSLVHDNKKKSFQNNNIFYNQHPFLASLLEKHNGFFQYFFFDFSQ
jgi:hypothetical protein